MPSDAGDSKDVPLVDAPKRKAPDVVYHYTTAAGLQGIIDSASLWATDLAYLNDSTEMRYGLEIFQTELLKHISHFRASDVLVSQMFDEAHLFERLRVFVNCFCEDGDLLSQWRGYSGAGGYCVGLDAKATGARLVKNGFSGRLLVNVLYGPEAASMTTKIWSRIMAEGMEPLLKQMIEVADRSSYGPSDDDVELVAKAMYEIGSPEVSRALILCSFLKHPAFEEEKEWRIIAPMQMLKLDPNTIQFRQGYLGLIPYIKINLGDGDGRLPIREVKVGPGSDQALRIQAVKLLLHTKGYSNVSVTASEAPFRGV